MKTNDVPHQEIAQGAKVDLRIMVTTDVHVSIMNYDYYTDRETFAFGLTQTAGLIKIAREETLNSLLLDNGDVIQGNPMGDYMAQQPVWEEGSIHPVYKAMNLLGYDAGNIGNHEFNYGLDYLQKCLDGANFPYINANLFIPAASQGGEERHYFTPYVILDKRVTDTDGYEHTLKIGIIGFAPPQVMQWDKSHLEGKIAATGMLEAARKFIPRMKEEGADIIIAMPHAGYEDIPEQLFQENPVLHLSRVEGIDAIVFGHAHKVFPGSFFDGKTGVNLEAGTIHDVPAVEPGFWGDHLGIIDLTLERHHEHWKVTGSSTEARPVYDPVSRRPLAETDHRIIEAVAQEHEATLQYIRMPVGATKLPIESFFALIMDDPSVQIVNDAQAWYVSQHIQGTAYEGLPVLSAGAPFKAGGRYGPSHYTNIPAGELAIKHIADLYNFPNTLHAVRLTGAEVKEWLEWSAGIFRHIDPEAEGEQELIDPDFPSFNFDMIDGIGYQIDVSQLAKYDPAGHLVQPDTNRIIHLTYQGLPMDMQHSFIVATNNYRAFSSALVNPDGQRIALASPDENRHVLMEYIRQTGTLNPYADHHWSFAPLPGNPQVTFLTSPDAVEAAKAYPQLTYIGVTANGFAKFFLDLTGTV